MARILVADDEPSMREVLAAFLERDGHEVETVSDGAEALARLRDASAPRVDCLQSDVRMPRMNGYRLLRTVRKQWPDLPVILLTAHATPGLSFRAAKAGAYDVLEKPFKASDVLRTVARAVAHGSASAAEPSAPRSEAIRLLASGGSAAMRRLVEVIRKAARSETTCLVLGETGTGKELVATAIHEASRRRAGPFVAVHCGAIPENLQESELFGYERGAFTGADRQKPGRVELAHRGTLFLDEIGDTAASTQVKLLRFLQERTFERVGGTRTFKADVRIVAATHRDLASEARSGRFREDLLFRLNVVPIHVPPLRDRREEIVPLARYFLAQAARPTGAAPLRLARTAEQWLAERPWPGNVRELQNLMARATVLVEGPDLGSDDLAAQAADGPAEGNATGRDRLSRPTSRPLRERRDASERTAIEQGLAADAWNVTRAAKRLEIGRRTLQMKMKRLGIRPAR